MTYSISFTESERRKADLHSLKHQEHYINIRAACREKSRTVSFFPKSSVFGNIFMFCLTNVSDCIIILHIKYIGFMCLSGG